MALSEAQLNELIDSVVRPNDRRAISAANLNRVLHEMSTATFGTGANMANQQLDIEEDFLHDGQGHFWGIANLSQIYFAASVPALSGASMKVRGYGSGADNQLFQVQNGLGSNAILTTGDLRTVFGGNIAVGGSPWYAKVTGQTAVPGEYGGFFTSQFDIAVRGASETAVAIQGESESGIGVRGISTANVGVFGISSLATGVYAQSYNYIAFQAIASSNRAAVMHGNIASDAVQIVNNDTSGGGIGLSATAAGGNIGIWGVGGNFGVVGQGVDGGYFYSMGGGWGLKAVANLGQGALNTDGKVIMAGLSDTPLLTNEVYVYDDGTRKYLCIN